jgi:hypothetical protein
MWHVPAAKNNWGYCRFRQDADGGEAVNSLSGIDPINREMFHTSQFHNHTVKIER